MKRIFAIILLLFVVTSISSCKITNLGNAEILDTTDKHMNSDPPGGIHGGEAQVFTSLEEYETYVASNIEIPMYFVKYEQLEALGSFKSFQFFVEYSLRPYDVYFYTLLCDSKTLDLKVEHGDVNLSLPNSDDIISDPLNDDLRFCQNEKNGYYIENGIAYEYVQGRLIDVCWISNDILFELFGAGDESNNLYNYPQNDSLVSRLLNKSTALEAKAEFEAMVFGNE